MSSIKHQIEKIMSSLTLEEKIGQLFILAFPGKNPEKLKPIIEKYSLGGCYISQDNGETFDEAKNLTTELQQMAKNRIPELPLILGVDQEGAWGVLIPESQPGPGNLALGAAHSPVLTEQMYQLIGQEMISAGYQTILGPCSDINLNPKNPIIGTRSFGEDPVKVAEHVQAAVKGIQKAGALSTAKHFPGHGDTAGDSHREIPTVNKSREELINNDFLPFQAAIDAGVDLIMTSHIRFPAIDPNFPATLSPKILKDLLRDEMGFEGLIITDSMNMGAIRKFYDPAESTLMALKAGADLIMLSEEHYDHSDNYLEKQIQGIERIIKAIRNGELDEAIVDSRLRRIIRFKLERMKNTRNSGIKTSEALSHIENYAAEAALTLVRNKQDCWPLKHPESAVFINATPRGAYSKLMNSRGIGPNQAKPAFDCFKEEIKSHSPHARFYDQEEIENNISELDEAATIIAITEDYPLPGEDFDRADQVTTVQTLIARYRHRVILIGLRSAYELKDYPDLLTYFCAHSSRDCSARAAAKAVLGMVAPKGVLPVTAD